MTYETRLQISKSLLAIMISLFIAAHIYEIYYMTILNDGHLFETAVNRIQADYVLREIVLRTLIMASLFTFLISKPSGNGDNTRLTGLTLSLIILSPWVTLIVANAARLPSDGDVGTIPWQACVSLALILLACIMTIEKNEFRKDSKA